MPTFTILPGTLNVKVKRGDTFSLIVDFTISLSGYVISSEVFSCVDGSKVADITVNGSLASEGQIVLSMSPSETAAIGDGTYRWRLEWQTGSQNRTAVEGVFEVVP